MKSSSMPLFKKLNLGDHDPIVVFNAPESFERELKKLDVAVIRDPKKPSSVTFALAFAVTQNELNRVSTLLAKASVGDAAVWFAYPKGTSKRYTCEFNRDTGWQVIRDAGFDSVRAVAIDDDWSALRFRRVEFIKSR
jgi:hypothetical protein